MIGAGRMGFMGSAYYEITDLQALTAINAQSFAYLAMPGGARTLENYLQSFGVTEASLNDNTTNWKNSFSGNLFFDAIPIANNNYFSEYGRVRVIDGDGTVDGPDRTVFNFGVANGAASFGNITTNKNFGGARTRSGNNGNLSGISTGTVWGFSSGTGWVLLYQIPIDVVNSSYTFNNGKWFTSSPGLSPNAAPGPGKRQAFRLTKITHLGFAVS